MPERDQKTPVGADLIIPVAAAAYAVYYVASVADFPFEALPDGREDETSVLDLEVDETRCRRVGRRCGHKGCNARHSVTEWLRGAGGAGADLMRVMNRRPRPA